MKAGSLLLFTQNPNSHFSFFLEGNVDLINFEPACVGLISHQGASAIGERHCSNNHFIWLPLVPHTIELSLLVFNVIELH